MNKRHERILFVLAIAIIAAVLVFGSESFLGATSFGQGIVVRKPARQPIHASSTSTKTVQASASPTSPPVTGADAFVTRVFTGGQGLSLTYYLYVPNGYTPEKQYPLVLVLHGGGEHSNPGWTAAQNKALLFHQAYIQVWEPGYAVPNNPNVQEQWPSFVVIPQIPTGQPWVNVPVHAGSYTQPSQPTPWLLMTKELLDALQKEYSGIDPARLYITGISLGAYGVWDAIERWPDYFAAAMPIAGAGDPSRATVLKNLPVWAFHGSNDQTVPVSGSRDMVAAIRAAGGHPQYTEYAGAGHGVWGYAYSTTGSAQQNTPGVLPWLFSQRRQETTRVSSPSHS